MRFDLVINMLCGLAVTKKKIFLNSNGKAWRPHLHIEDASQAIMNAINFDNDELTIFNVGMNKNNLRIIDAAEIIKNEIENC